VLPNYPAASTKDSTDKMIDILVYLFENYLPDACPEPEVLARKLSAAGFGSDDITAALSWLDGLAGEGSGRCSTPLVADAIRIYDEEEQDRLPAACRGFITFLEQHDAVDAPLREAIIERALALPDAEVSLDRLKVIVLAVIWRYRHEVDALILEELLAEDSEDEDLGGGEDITRILLN
jgi:Smg protein